MEPEVLNDMAIFFNREFGNPSSRTHGYGQRAKSAVNEARLQVSRLVKANPEDVILTSGATESNNIAILGMAKYLEDNDRKHIITSTIEHKAVLEPIDYLESKGFEVTRINPSAGGWIDPSDVKKAINSNTGLVSIMHVNNETGVIQPLSEIADIIQQYPCFFHTDAAQGFGKENKELLSHNIHMISISAHKIFGPKGVGALILKRRNNKRPPLTPIMFGGGQENGLRPGTIAAPLVVGLGKAAHLCENNMLERARICSEIKSKALAALLPLGILINGQENKTLPSTLNFSIPGVDSEALLLSLKDLVAASNGSACTSNSYSPSHVLIHMSLPEERIREAIRLSWCHLTPDINWELIAKRISQLT